MYIVKDWGYVFLLTTNGKSSDESKCIDTIDLDFDTEWWKIEITGILKPYVP